MRQRLTLVFSTLLLVGAFADLRAIEIIHQSATASASIPGSSESLSLPTNAGGSLFVELGTPAAGSDYAQAMVSSVIFPIHISLSAASDVDHAGGWGLASAEIVVDFVVTQPNQFTISRSANAVGGGFLGYVCNVRFLNPEGWIWEYSQDLGVSCNTGHSLSDLCWSGPIPPGPYTVELNDLAHYPPDCGSCHGYAISASSDVVLAFQLPSQPLVLHVEPDSVVWDATPDASMFDVVEGSLQTLRSSGGDFTQAARECLADDASGESVDHFEDPSAGEGFWFLARKAGTGWAGTYDSTGGGQIGSRNGAIDDSPSSCP